MTTVLAVYNHKGCIGFCNSSCYDAKQPSDLKGRFNGRYIKDGVCRCICGGANHAMGLGRALKNRERLVGLTDAALQSFAKLNGFKVEELHVIDRLGVPDAVRARKIALAALNPPPLAPDDLFFCEELEPAACSEGPVA